MKTPDQNEVTQAAVISGVSPDAEQEQELRIQLKAQADFEHSSEASDSEVTGKLVIPPTLDPDPRTTIPPAKVIVVARVEGYAIEEGVELPKAHSGTGRRFKYPLDHLKVGQSIFIPGFRTKDVAGSVRNMNRTKHPDLKGRKFVSIAHWAVDGRGEAVEPRQEGVRIQRVA